MSRISAYGISVEVPRGWDGAVYRRSAAASGSLRVAADGGETHPIVHLASFPLPAQRGDYGSGAVERMRPEDVLVCLLEIEASAGSTPQFTAQGVPRFRVSDFDPAAMQRTVQGMCGAQSFFTEAGRAFGAYVVLGSWRGRGALVSRANEALATVQIDPAGS